jgi:hypothetical protein
VKQIDAMTIGPSTSTTNRLSVIHPCAARRSPSEAKANPIVTALASAGCYASAWFFVSVFRALAVPGSGRRRTQAKISGWRAASWPKLAL